jgi:hypothetical protein
MSTSIIKGSELIRQHIRQRIKELNLTYDKIVTEGVSYGQKFSKGSLSRYLNTRKNQQSEGMTETNLIWLCMRLGIYVAIHVKLNEYSEQQCMENINKHFK